MDTLQLLFLGLVQGVTEWLPISSSGHLVLIQAMMGLNMPVAFDALLHAGTLLSVCVYFRMELRAIARALVSLETGSDDFRMAAYVLVGSLPTAAAALLLRGVFESFFSNMVAVGTGFLITAVAIALSKLRVGGKRGIDFRIAFLVGTIQAAAIAPGISRSGVTISSALMAGAERPSAFRFSFLLSIPAILGALVVELSAMQTSQFDWGYLIGFVASAIVGFASIGVVRRVVISDRFQFFSIYCLLVGLVTLSLQLL